MCAHARLCVYTRICPYGINNPLLLSGPQSNPSVSPQKTNFTGDVQFFTDTYTTYPHTETGKRQKGHTNTEEGKMKEEGEMARKWNREEGNGAKSKGMDGGE